MMRLSSAILARDQPLALAVALAFGAGWVRLAVFIHERGSVKPQMNTDGHG